jgi:hypothetical protein
MASSYDYDYEPVTTRDWHKHDEESVRPDLDPYGLETLDLIWFPLLRRQLKSGVNIIKTF